MPILRNAKHERFCHAVVDGQATTKAYEFAGFKPDRGNASTLRSKDSIVRRIGELFEERQRERDREIKKATEKAAFDRADVIKRLIHLSVVAEKDEQHGPAVRAMELLGKELGMFIDRQLRKDTDDIFETMDDAELRRLALERARQLSSDDSESDATRH